MIGRSAGVIKSIRAVTGDVTDYWISRNETARHAGNELLAIARPFISATSIYWDCPFAERNRLFSGPERSAVSVSNVEKHFEKLAALPRGSPLSALTKKLDLYLLVRFFLYFFFFFFFDQHENFISTRAGTRSITRVGGKTFLFSS